MSGPSGRREELSPARPAMRNEMAGNRFLFSVTCGLVSVGLPSVIRRSFVSIKTSGSCIRLSAVNDSPRPLSYRRVLWTLQGLPMGLLRDGSG